MFISISKFICKKAIIICTKRQYAIVSSNSLLKWCRTKRGFLLKLSLMKYFYIIILPGYVANFFGGESRLTPHCFRTKNNRHFEAPPPSVCLLSYPRKYSEVYGPPCKLFFLGLNSGPKCIDFFKAAGVKYNTLS